MSITKFDTQEEIQEGKISIDNLSEHDKGEILKYLDGDNYIQKGDIKTDSIDNPKTFFESINSLSDERKRELLNKLKEYFQSKNKLAEDAHRLEDIKEEKNKNKAAQDKEAEGLKAKLYENQEESNSNKYMKRKINEIKKFYNNQIKIIDDISYKQLKDGLDNLIDTNSAEFKKNTKTIIQFCNNFNLSINDNTISNLKKIKDIVEILGKRTGEHIYGIIGNDGSLHLINDIDTGHYIIPKNLMEKGDVSSFLRNTEGKIDIIEEKVKKLEFFDSHSNKVIQIGENVSLY